MGLRSRALLGGIARGFLKSNNDRHDRMEQRAAELAQKQGIMARERAKSAYTAAVQAAQEEEKTWNEYKGKDWIDDEGNFKSAYYRDQTYDKWKESEYKTQEEFINIWKQGRDPKLTRSYKSPQVLQKEMASIYNSIDNREREELARPVLTGFERMMGFGIVKGAQAGASAFNAGAKALGVDARAEAIPMPEAVQGGPQSSQGQSMQTINPNVPQAQQIPTEDDTEGSMGTEGTEESPKYFSKPKARVGVTAVREAGEVFLGQQHVPNAVEADYVNEDGVEVTGYGVMDANNNFTPMPNLTTYRTEIVEEDPNLYQGSYNQTMVKEVQDILHPASNALDSINKLERTFNPEYYGSEKFFSEVGNFFSAGYTVFSSDYSGGYGDKAEVLAAMQKQANMVELPADLQAAIAEGNQERIAELSQTYANAEYDASLRALQDSGLNEKQKEIMSKFERSSISAEIQPLVRDLLRVWSGGDKKVAWGAAEKLIEDLTPTSTEEDFLGQIRTYKSRLIKDSYRQLDKKFEASKFSPVNDTAKGFIDQKVGDFPRVEYRQNPNTGEIMLIKTGVDREGRRLRYFIPSNSMVIHEVRLPTSDKKAPPLTQYDYRRFQNGQRLLDQFSVELSSGGYKVN